MVRGLSSELERSVSTRKRDGHRGAARWCPELAPSISPQGEVVACRAEVGGGRSSGDGGDNTTLPERRASSRVCVERCTRPRGLPHWLATPPTFVVVLVVVAVVVSAFTESIS